MSETPASDPAASRIPCDRFLIPADPASRTSAWRDHLAPVFTAQIARDADLSAGIGLATYHFGDVLLGTVSAPAQRLERDARMIARQGIDHVLIQFYAAGQSKVEIGRRAGAVKPLQMVVFDLSQPVVTEAGAVSATNIMLPRALLADHVATIENMHGQSLDYGAEPVRRLFHTYLTGLMACADEVDTHQARQLSQAAANLCGACFEPRDAAALASDRLTGIAIRRFIEEEIASEGIGVNAIVARFGVSRTALYRLFEAEGGVVSYIRERRLLRAMRMLTASDGRLRIAAVAYATGFSDERSFSRAFHRRFGLSPRDARGNGPVPHSVHEETSALSTWMKTLVA